MESQERQQHWDLAYADGDAQVSWRQAEASKSLELISHIAPRADASVIDVGGGSSTLVDGLIGRRFQDITVMDVSPRGLELAQTRLGPQAVAVQWLVADLFTWKPARQYGIWHDRAVLHFLTEAAQQQGYVGALLRAVEPGGHAIIGVFAEDGPEQCSGLEVRRYGAADLRSLLGDQFRVVSIEREEHRTPSGKIQPFNWIVAKRP